MTTVQLTAAIKTEGAGKATTDLENFAKEAKGKAKEFASEAKESASEFTEGAKEAFALAAAKLPIKTSFIAMDNYQ